MRGNGVAHADAHGGVRAGVEAQAGVGDREDAAADVHGVGAFGDVDDGAVVGRGEAVQDGFDGGEGAGVGHGQGGLGGFARGRGEVAGFGGGEVAGVGGGGGVVVPRAEGGDELRDDGEEIAVDGEVGGRVVEPEGFGADVHLDKLRGAVPFGRGPEVEDPVQARAEEEDDVGFGEGGATCASGVEGVGVWDHAFTHGGGEEGEIGVGDELADGRFGAGVGCAFADDYEGGFCGFE